MKKTMAHLHSVNVGLPRDISWRGKTVHTDVWYAGSTSSATDKGIWLGMVANTEPFLSIKLTPIAIGKSSLVEAISSTGSSGKTSRSMGCLIKRYVSAIATGLAALSSKLRSRESPAIGWESG